MKRVSLIVAFVILAITVGNANSQPRPLPIVRPGIDGVLAAFQNHSLVGLAEVHGLAQQMDFYSALIRDPRFAREIGNIVLETGDAAQQDVANRYVNGENVPYPLLRKVWADTVGWIPAVTSVGSINVYAVIREVNMTLPPDRRIRVWLGDPPINWPQIKTKSDLLPFHAKRDSYPAALIEREILAKNKKALVIYGADHLRLGIYASKDNLRGLIERARPGALFIVMPYVGYAKKTCAARFEGHIKGWPIPALIETIRGSSWEKDMFQPGCGIISRPSTMTEDQYEQLMRDYLVQMSDALLYLGPRDHLVLSPDNPDIYLDLDYRAELNRRAKIRGDSKIEGEEATDNTAVAKPFFPN